MKINCTFIFLLSYHAVTSKNVIYGKKKNEDDNVSFDASNKNDMETRLNYRKKRQLKVQDEREVGSNESDNIQEEENKFWDRALLKSMSILATISPTSLPTSSPTNGKFLNIV